MSPLSTMQVAKAVGIDRVTLERWLSSGRVKMPKTIRIGARDFRLWTEIDVARLKKYSAAHKFEGRGRKKKGE
jgi:predicted site-specific integrase-resolvase